MRVFSMFRIKIFMAFYYYFLACDPAINDHHCCNNWLCHFGEGDCDRSDQCEGDLVCGKDNCKIFNPDTIKADFDCCEKGNSTDLNLH